VKFGLWYDFRNPQGQPWSALYGELLDQIEWADTAGFDSVWLSEHHVTDDGYMPSVFVMLAAIAGRTQNLRLGTAVCLAPLHHPIRLAEDVAVVDILSGGRVELGLAPGYRPFEFEVLDVPRRQRGVRTDETVEILRLAWTGESFSYSGRVFDLRDVVVQPVPQRGPALAIHIGGSSPAAALRAGRYGCNFMPDVGTGTDLHRQYRAALDASGFDADTGTITMNGCVFVCEDPERGRAQVHQSLTYMYERYDAWERESDDTEVPAFEPIDIERLDELCIVGTPDEVIRRVAAIRNEFAPDRFIFWGRLPGMPIEDASRSLRLFVDEVMPALG
jgi:alkanesulfonate monooxygenase SsuD/methylene tetrahydromethanopterin reductase-like flavin-dependent oxidoreductase (luciferase family)